MNEASVGRVGVVVRAVFAAGVIACTISARAADEAPAGKELELLKTFRKEFVAITPGKGAFPNEFVMGRDDGEASERPARRVAMSRSFWIAKYEVPQNLWQAVMGANPSRWQGVRNSVEMLTFDEAESFCAKATQRLRTAGLIGAKQIVHLPTEAEWEYCARAGTTSIYSFGDDAARLGEYGWSTENAADNDPPVGAKKPNAWGLYDMHGYLWEWCADTWHDNYERAPKDAHAWTDGNDRRRVLRSGSWKDKAARLTSSSRRAAAADLKDDAVGLRCVLADG